LALIARALAQAAPLLVMEEPTASLDFGNQALVHQHIASGSCRVSGW
jgi:iron complex transport system ATP-binding protein